MTWTPNDIDLWYCKETPAWTQLGTQGWRCELCGYIAASADVGSWHHRHRGWVRQSYEHAKREGALFQGSLRTFINILREGIEGELSPDPLRGSRHFPSRTAAYGRCLEFPSHLDCKFQISTVRFKLSLLSILDSCPLQRFDMSCVQVIFTEGKFSWINSQAKHDAHAGVNRLTTIGENKMAGPDEKERTILRVKKYEDRGFFLVC